MNETKAQSSTLRKRLGAIGVLLVATAMLSGCYVGPAGCYHCGGGGWGGGWHHDHWR